jgi:hypothetical protein
MSSAIALMPAVHRPGETSLAALGPARPARLEGAERKGNVAPVRTPVTASQASALIGDALEHVTGEKPKPETVAILTAQWAHETGHGASMYNYNFAGIKGAGPSGLTVAQRTREGHGASERTIVDNFRAYQTAEEGARDYVALLERRFPAALDAAKQGDPAATVRALNEARYFTGDEVAYTRSVTRIAKELVPGSLDFAAEPLPTLPVDFDAAIASHDYAGPGLSGAPFVNASAMSDHILRAALRILSAPAEEQERNGVST